MPRRPTGDESEFVTVAEAARMLAVDRSTVYRYFDAGLVTGRQYPTGTMRISRASVAQLIDESTPRPRSA